VQETTRYTDSASSAFDIDGVVLTMVPVATKKAVGKIVVPASWNNLPVIGIIGFSHQDAITHIFFESNNEIRTIGTACCKDMTALKYVDFLSLLKLRKIDSEAFYRVNNLGLVNSIGDSGLSVLNIVEHDAFNHAFSSTYRPNGANLIEIPASITTLGNKAFAFQSLTPYSVSLTIGTPQFASLLTMPILAPNIILENNPSYFGANNHYEFNNIDFYSAMYEGNATIEDTNGNAKGKLAEYFGLVRDSQ
jgi:hypothetical protein